MHGINVSGAAGYCFLGVGAPSCWGGRMSLHCAGLGWLECSGKAILCQRYISFGAVLLPSVLSYMASLGGVGMA